jgi:hypothetical protein
MVHLNTQASPYANPMCTLLKLFFKCWHTRVSLQPLCTVSGMSGPARKCFTGLSKFRKSSCLRTFEFGNWEEKWCVGETSHSRYESTCRSFDHH